MSEIVEVVYSVGDVIQPPARHEAHRVVWTMHPEGGPGSKVLTVTELDEADRRITATTYAAAWVVYRIRTRTEGADR